ncbi:unnamed protein product [Camellia sinensis]
MLKRKNKQQRADPASITDINSPENRTDPQNIPKKEIPVSLSDFRPISLISFIYKILSKVLTKRLKLVLPNIVSEAQLAFLGGRNILNGVLIANEIVDWWKKSNKQGVIIKLDFEKAFDTVSWEFIFDLLVKFRFGPKWLGWMKSCLSTANISILVNGSPIDEIQLERGLRQGDPLSPFLFNIVAEGLNLLLTRAKDLGLIRGAVVGPNGLEFTHLQFAEDTIVFCEADLLEITTLKMPKCVIKEVDKIQASFLWGDSDVKRKVHLVSWKDVSMTKNQGGLGIRSLGQVNECLLAKW